MSKLATANLREENAARTRELLIATAISLIEAGEEPTMRAIAQTARLGERTVYRYFPSHEELVRALAPTFQRRTGAPLCSRFDGLAAYARTLFTTFDENRSLTTALVTAPWAAPHVGTSRRKNLDDLRHLIDVAFPAAPASERAAASASLRALLSGVSWHYLRVSCEVPNAQIIAAATFAIETCASRLSRFTRRRP